MCSGSSRTIPARITEDGAELASRSRLLFTRGYCVFNAAQVDGYTPKADADMSMPERIAHAEAFFQRDRRRPAPWRKPSLLRACDGPYPDAAIRRVRGKRVLLFDARARAYALDGERGPL